jgi:hypothetical protein
VKIVKQDKQGAIWSNSRNINFKKSEEIRRNPGKGDRRPSAVAQKFDLQSLAPHFKPSPVSCPAGPPPKHPKTTKSTRSCHVSIGFHLGQVSDNGSLCASIGSHRCLGNAKAFDSFFDQANLLGAEMRGLELSAGKKAKSTVEHDGLILGKQNQVLYNIYI